MATRRPMTISKCWISKCSDSSKGTSLHPPFHFMRFMCSAAIIRLGVGCEQLLGLLLGGETSRDYVSPEFGTKKVPKKEIVYLFVLIFCYLIYYLLLNSRNDI